MATDKNRIKQITELVKKCCDESLDEDYYKTAKKLINKLKKNKDFSMDNGKIEGWVAGILCIIGEDSGLFNRSNEKNSKIYLSKTCMADIAGVNVATMKNRASNIREALPKNAKFITDIAYGKDYVSIEQKILNGKAGLDEEDIRRMRSILKMFKGETNNRKEKKIKKLEEYQIYLEKAKKADNIDESIENVKLALMHAKNKIPENIFKELEGELWLYPDARPYLTIKSKLAYLYIVKEDYESAMEIHSEILKLNVEDNQGIRYKMFPILILLDKNEKIEDLLKTYDTDDTAFMLYNQALYNYKNRDELKAKSFLKKAFKSNKYVPEYLLGMRKFDLPAPRMYSLGSKEEAVIYLDDSLFAWVETDNALYWVIDEYFAYAKVEGIDLFYTKAEVKDFIDDAIENVRNMKI